MMMIVTKAKVHLFIFISVILCFYCQNFLIFWGLHRNFVLTTDPDFRECLYLSQLITNIEILLRMSHNYFWNWRLKSVWKKKILTKFVQGKRKATYRSTSTWEVKVKWVFEKQAEQKIAHRSVPVEGY